MICALVFGRAGAFPSEIRLADIERGQGVYFIWKPTDRAWLFPSIGSVVGDLNGDGLSDLLFQLDAHRAAVVFGSHDFR